MACTDQGGASRAEDGGTWTGRKRFVGIDVAKAALGCVHRVGWSAVTRHSTPWDVAVAPPKFAADKWELGFGAGASELTTAVEGDLMTAQGCANSDPVPFKPAEARHQVRQWERSSPWPAATR
jgi:hypothetical protein